MKIFIISIIAYFGSAFIISRIRIQNKLPIDKINAFFTFAPVINFIVCILIFMSDLKIAKTEVFADSFNGYSQNGRISQSLRDISRNLIVKNGSTSDEDLDIDAEQINDLDLKGGDMKKILIEVEWVHEKSTANKHLEIWAMKAKNEWFCYIAGIAKIGDLYFNNRGTILRKSNGDQLGYNTLDKAKKAIEDHFMAQHINSRVNNLEVTNA